MTLTRRSFRPLAFPRKMRQAHTEYLTSEDNCGLLANSDLEEHGYGENLFLCYGEANCMMAPGVLESICECGVEQ